ncbi:MAG TPA: M48 family metallopeptidase [Terriglobia bacterium]|nr:M48 family metallopeptidase [Terriglobia bacterium]
MKTCFWLTVPLILMLFCFDANGWSAAPRLAPQGTEPKAEQVAPAEARLAPPPEGYELPAQKKAEAIAYSRTRYALYFAGVALALLVYFLLWRARIAVAFRDWARRRSRRHFLQCLLFAPLFFVTVQLLEFPFDFYSDYVIEHKFGLSNQGFVSWAGDWGKNLALLVLVGTFLVWIFYAVVRRSPRRWWFYFWAVTIPVTLFLMFIEPFAVEPLFFKFTPLQTAHPALVARIEEMLDRAGLEIPRSRMLEMNASSKTRTINAYVSGLGKSKRVVVWDNTLQKLTDDETLLVLGHETGHYVLHHILKEFVLIELIALALIAMGFVGVRRLLRRFGNRTGIESEGDLASLPVMLMVLTALSFFASPAVNGVSRHYEHQADQFALEVTYGVVPDPDAAEARAFQILGEQDLADPDPSTFIVFWLYSHPPLNQRIRFARSYHPWTEGKPLQFVHPGKS